MEKIRSLAGTLLVLVCLSATAGSSSSLTWAWRSPANAQHFQAIAFGGGIYVAVGQDGVIYSSPDRTTWSPQSSIIGVGGQYVDAIYANGLFLLSGVDSAGTAHVTSSPDGVTWTDSTLSFGDTGAQPQLELVFGGGIYVVMGGSHDATSSDGITWTSHTLGFGASDRSFPSLFFASGVFVKAGSSGSHLNIFYSSDGVTWNASANMQDVNNENAFASDGTTFFMFVNNAKSIYTSTDGNHWTKHTPTGNYPSDPASPIWNGTEFLTIGFGSTTPTSTIEYAFSSTDALAWTRHAAVTTPSQVGLSTIDAIDLGHTSAYDGTGYVAVSDGILDILHSSDFATWTTATSVPAGPQVDFADMLHAGSRYVAIGQDSSSHKPAIVASPDGLTWNKVNAGTGGKALTTVAYGKGAYVAGGAGGLIMSTDTVNWSSIAGLSEIDSAIQFGNSRFVAFSACSSKSCTSATSADGKTWITHAVPASLASSGAYTALGFDGTRFVSIGTAIFTYTSFPAPNGVAPVYTSCDGVTWSHSADISVPPPPEGVASPTTDTSITASFGRIRLLGSKLVALGSIACYDPDTPDTCLGVPAGPVIVNSADATHWSATTEDFESDFTDIAFDGKTYYAAQLGDSGPQSGGFLLASTDLAKWDVPTGFPVSATVNTFVNDGSHLYAAGSGDDILAAAVSGAGSAPVGGVCKALPAISDTTPTPPAVTNTSGSSGSFDMLTLLGLLGVFVARRRAAI